MYPKYHTTEVVTCWITGGSWRWSLSGLQLVPLQIDDLLLPDSRDRSKRLKNPDRKWERLRQTGRRGWRNSRGEVWVWAKKKCGRMASGSRCIIATHRRDVYVCGGRAGLWSPRTCRLSAAGCGSQLSGELREREEARWKEGQRQTGTGASARSLQMNGDKSARAIDPLVKAPLRLQPNVLKKETSAPVGALGGRQSSSDETHPPHDMKEIDRQSYIYTHYGQKSYEELHFAMLYNS